MNKTAKMMVVMALLSAAVGSRGAMILQLRAVNYDSGTGTWTADTGPNATQSTAANRPSLVAGATPNGTPVVRFDGVNDWLALASAIGNTTGTDAYSVFAVVRPDDTTSGAKTIVSGNINSFQYRIHNTEVQQVNKNNVLNLGSSSTAVSTTDYSIIGVTFSSVAGERAFRLNGVADGTMSYADITAQLTRIGTKEQDTAELFKGDIAELRIYNTVLTSSEIATVETELYNAHLIPEPSTMGLMGLVFVARFLCRRRG